MLFVSIVSMKYILTVILFSFFISISPVLCPLYSEDLNWFLDTALKNDYQLKIDRLALKNTKLGIKKNNMDAVFSLTLSAENTGVSYSWADKYLADGTSVAPFTVYSSPSVILRLADPLETQITAGADASVGMGSPDGSTSLELYPRLSINQPLNKILKLENSTQAQDIADKLSVKQLEIEILKRETELKILVLNRLKDIYSSEKSLQSININIMNAQKAFNDAVKLGTYNSGSSKFIELKYGLVKLKRQQNLVSKTLENKNAELKRLLGSAFKSLPERLPEVKLALPSLDNMALNPDMYLAYLRILKDRATLNEQATPDVPVLSAGVSVSSGNGGTADVLSTGKADTDISGTFKGVFENLSFSAAVGGMVNSKSVYLKTGISWSIPDNRIKNIDEDISRNVIASDELQVKLLRDSFLSKRENIRLELEEFKNRDEDLRADTEIAKLKLKEAKIQYNSGIISEEELKSLQWQLDSLTYDRKALLLDKLLAGQEIAGLVLNRSYLDNEKEKK